MSAFESAFELGKSQAFAGARLEFKKVALASVLVQMNGFGIGSLATILKWMLLL